MAVEHTVKGVTVGLRAVWPLVALPVVLAVLAYLLFRRRERGTAYWADGSLDGLLEAPDSLLLTRSTNYAIGDPERGRTGVVEATDTRVGEPTTVTYRGESRPDATDPTFQQVGAGRYRDRLQRHVDEVRDRLEGLGVEHAVVDTDTDFFDSFASLWFE
jgi:hypothetical protein